MKKNVEKPEGAVELTRAIAFGGAEAFVAAAATDAIKVSIPDVATEWIACQADLNAVADRKPSQRIADAGILMNEVTRISELDDPEAEGALNTFLQRILPDEKAVAEHLVNLDMFVRAATTLMVSIAARASCPKHQLLAAAAVQVMSERQRNNITESIAESVADTAEGSADTSAKFTESLFQNRSKFVH